MFVRIRWLAWSAALCSFPALIRAQGVEWSEAEILERFQTQGPQIRALETHVALVESEARARAVYFNPAVSYSREGAGYNAFFEASQTLPVSGRLRYLHQAVGAARSAAGSARDASLWSLRTDLRLAFYSMLAAQQRVDLISSRVGEVEQLVSVLRRREEEGEGSRYDRLRAERELVELRIDIAGAQSLVADAGARVAGFLPEGTRVGRVRGVLQTPSLLPDVESLVRRALNARADYRAEQGSQTRAQIEEQAARRLRIPEPIVSAGVKRADVILGAGPNPFANVTRTGLAFSITVPLPVLNSGRYEWARYQAEQEQAGARLAVLARQIRTEVEGARAVLAVRRDALAAYEREIRSTGPELIRIATTAYQEGEVGILELLDAYRVDRAANLRRLELESGVKGAFIELERAVGEELRGMEVQP